MELTADLRSVQTSLAGKGARAARRGEPGAAGAEDLGGCWLCRSAKCWQEYPAACALQSTAHGQYCHTLPGPLCEAQHAGDSVGCVLAGVQVGSYAFTTLQPQLGVVSSEDMRLLVADIPGLIPGASNNRGLGHAFLKHVERTGVLAFVLDVSTGLHDKDGLHPCEQLKMLQVQAQACYRTCNSSIYLS